MHELLHICVLLDHDDAEVVVAGEQGHSQRSITVDILSLQVAAPLLYVHGADRGTPLGGVVKWCSLPLVRYVYLESFAATEAAHSLDRVDLFSVLPASDLHEGIMEWRSMALVSQVDVDPQVDEYLFCLEGGIGRRTGHVDSMM